MKLLVSLFNHEEHKFDPINNEEANEALTLASEFYCKAESTEHNILITQNPQLTNNEFSLLAGKLVIAGFTVELAYENAEFDEKFNAIFY